MSKFKLSDLGHDMSFYWDPSFEWCVCGVPIAQTGPVEYWVQGKGEMVDCNLPSDVREKICRGEMGNVSYKEWECITARLATENGQGES